MLNSHKKYATFNGYSCQMDGQKQETQNRNLSDEALMLHLVEKYRTCIH